jgi:hypothetical protein
MVIFKKKDILYHVSCIPFSMEMSSGYAIGLPLRHGKAKTEVKTLF